MSRRKESTLVNIGYGNMVMSTKVVAVHAAGIGADAPFEG